MNNLNIILLIICIILIILGVLYILYRYNNEKLNTLISKIDGCEKDCFEKLNRKYDMICRYIESIEDKLKIESKIFDDIKKLKITSIKSYKHEKELNKCYLEIKQICDDKKRTKEAKNLMKQFKNYEENELEIVALRTYYNKSILEYNNTIKKAPISILANFKKLKVKTLIEGPEINNNFNNDLEV